MEEDLSPVPTALRDKFQSLRVDRPILTVDDKMYYTFNLRLFVLHENRQQRIKKIGSVYIITNKLTTCFEIRTSWCSFFHDYLQT